MPMTRSDVQRIAIEVARERDDRLKVEAAIPAEGDSAYTEIILTIRGCQDDPCLLMIGVSRDAAEASVRATIEERLREHLLTHSAETTARRSS